MRRMWKAAAGAALAVGAALAAPAAGAVDAVGVVEEGVEVDGERIDEWMQDRMGAHGIPGAAVAVVRGGEVVHLAGYGVADPEGTPVTPHTPFVIGSASKPFTAMVVRQLVQEGELSLQDRVEPYLSGLVEEMPAGFEDVTVGQLLNHTGGLGMEVGLAGTVEVHEGEDALDRRVAELLDQPLAREPGQEWEYSNAGAMLLAAVVEQVTGERFADQLRGRVFDPLQMSDSFASEEDPRAEALATGHWSWFGQWRASGLPYDNAGVAMGYIGSSAHDLARFLQAHLGHHDGPGVIPATAAEMAAGPVADTGWDFPLEGGYGLGWFVDDLGGEPVVSHSGSLGHFTAHLVMAPGADDLGVAVLSNASAFVASGHEGQYDLSLGLTRMLLDQDPEPTTASPLMTVVVPVACWALPVLLTVAAARFLLVTRRRYAGTVQASRRVWARLVALPAAAYLALGAVILTTVPLASARHFYPDAGWGLTVSAYLALSWAVLRTVLAATALTSATRKPGADTATGEHRSARRPQPVPLTR
ncbi:serine hydrolase domain-containing protein [Ornithinicoccus halotolerans]|uniref:serine hydrolase domain-containing protein n=1 Tax=Ornithinicoccus halotolerans TaxID=1748220 RepID=UPI0012948E5E|nr:serine hydrolase domain-containing protein [Ornithinicoccus halotolerans]